MNTLAIVLLRLCFDKLPSTNDPSLWFPSRRSVSDPGSDVVPCWLGFRQGPAVLRSRRGSVPGRTLFHGLGLLHCHGRHRTHLHLCCLLRTGRDRHLQRQGPGGDRGGEKPHLPPLKPRYFCPYEEKRRRRSRRETQANNNQHLPTRGWPVNGRLLHCLPLKLTLFVSVLCLCGRNWQVPSFFLSVCLRLSATRGAVSVIVFMSSMWTTQRGFVCHHMTCK